MENAEEVLHYLEDFTKRKPKTIPQELNEYLAHVARTGDPIYQWSLVKALFKEKLLNVITDFYETTPGLDIPTYPNVDPFNYDIMKNSLLERLDSFNAAPFTIQRICELLTFPRKQYNRIDKFMRAVEKNILVVSTREPGPQRMEIENGEANDPIVNGSDNNSDYNVDVEMDDMSWKEKSHDPLAEPQPGSSDAHISVDDIEARLQSKDYQKESQEKASEFISLTPPDCDEPEPIDEPLENAEPEPTDTNNTPEKQPDTIQTAKEDTASDVIPSTTEEPVITPMVIPEITIDDAEMTEQKLTKQASIELEAVTAENLISPEEAKEQKDTEPEIQLDETVNGNTNEMKEDTESPKLSEVMTSSEESSSSSDNTDGASNSPKPTSEEMSDNSSTLPEEPFKADVLIDSNTDEKVDEVEKPEAVLEPELAITPPPETIESDNYSISDVNSELAQPALPSETPAETKTEETPVPEKVDEAVKSPKASEQIEAETKEVDEKGDA